MTTGDAARIQSSEAKAGSGGVQAEGFAARAQVRLLVVQSAFICMHAHGKTSTYCASVQRKNDYSAASSAEYAHLEYSSNVR
jgi:hypothetical protein